MEPGEQTGLLSAGDGAPTYDGPVEVTAKPRWVRRAAGLAVTAMLIAAVLGVLWAVFGLPPWPAPSLPDPGDTSPMRIMVVGNSISQGWEGDYTWRYRLWEWLRQNNVSATFVGPYTGTAHSDDQLLAAMALPLSPADAVPPTVTANMDGGYALDVAPEFLDSGNAHFAIWGRQAAQNVDVIGMHVRAYRPDYLLIELGFNDLGWFVSGPEGPLQSMKRMVDHARAANPELKFAVANVPHRLKLEGRDDLPIMTRQYNAMLLNAIPLWSFPSSPIELVKFQEAYSCKGTCGTVAAAG